MTASSVLLIGASRGLGYALAAEYLQRGCRLVATVRGTTRTKLHDLLQAANGRLEIETVDIDLADQTLALHTRLQGRIFRASKAALNTLMRSFAARHGGDPRTLLLMAPGWVRTDMGGPDARLSVEESVPKLVDVIDAQAGKRGLRYLDYLGRTVPW